MSDLRGPRAERAVIDLFHRLRVTLPAMAQEAAAARREAAGVQAENARPAQRVAELAPAPASLSMHRRGPVDA